MYSKGVAVLCILTKIMNDFVSFGKTLVDIRSLLSSQYCITALLFAVSPTKMARNLKEREMVQ